MKMFENQVEENIIIPLQYNRLRRRLLFLGFFNCTYGLILIIVVLVAIFSFSSIDNPSFRSFLIFVEIIVVSFILLLLFIIANGIWMIFLMIRRLTSQKPVLIINKEGITVCDLLGTQFLSWTEIDTLSVSIYRHAYGSASVVYLGIYLRNANQYLLHLRPIRRFLLRQTTRFIGTPIGVPEWYLAIPVTEILEQTQRIFSSIMQLYNIQVIWQ